VTADTDLNKYETEEVNCLMPLGWELIIRWVLF